MWTHHTRQHLAERSLTDRKHRKLQDSELLLLYPTRSHLSVSAIGPNTPFQPEELCGESFKLQIGQREEALPETGWQEDHLDTALLFRYLRHKLCGCNKLSVRSQTRSCVMFMT